MSNITCNCGYTARRSVAFVFVSILISMVLIIAGWTNAYVLTPYAAYFIANAKSEVIGSSEGHGGAVPLIPLNSGNGELDHHVNQFFKCIKKTGHTGGTNGEPSKEEVNNCYNIVFASGVDSSNSNFDTEHDHNHSNSAPAGSQSHRHISHTDIFVS
jgi:hypothetical protein